MFAMASVRLMESVETGGVKQLWYADDANGLGKIDPVVEWLCKVEGSGKEMGYLVNRKKTILIVKAGVGARAREALRRQGLMGVEVHDLGQRPAECR